MKIFSKKFGVIIFVVLSAAVFGLGVFADRASAATVYSYGSCDPNETNCGEYFQSESPIVKDFRIDTTPKTFNIPVSGPHGGPPWPPFPITVTPEVSTLPATPTSGTGSCTMLVTGPKEIIPKEGPLQFGFILGLDGDGQPILKNFIVDAQGCQSQVTTVARTFNSTLTVNGTWPAPGIYYGPDALDCGSPAMWFSFGPNGPGCYSNSPKIVPLSVSIFVTLHPRAPVIGLTPSAGFSAILTPYYPVISGTFTVKNTGDANTFLDSSAAKSSPLASWLNFRSTSVGDGRGNPLGQSVSSIPLNFSVDGSLLNANGYVPGVYNSGITVINDRGSTPIPAENSPQNLTVSVKVLPPGVSVVVGSPPTGGGLTFSPIALNVEISRGEPTLFVLINNGYKGRGAYSIELSSSATGDCTGQFFSTSPLFETQWPVALNCPSSDGVYSGDLTFSAYVCYASQASSCGASVYDTVKVPYRVTVTANPAVRVITYEATNVTFDSAKLNGIVKASSPVWVGFQYSKQPLTTSNPGTQTTLQYIADSSPVIDFPHNLSYLLDGDTYYFFRAVAYPNDLSKVFYGSTMFFKTPAAPPITITCQQDCNFTALAGGAPANYTLVANTPGSYTRWCGLTCNTIYVTEHVSVTGPSWLSVLPPKQDALPFGAQGATTNSTFTLSVNPSLLTAGNYQGRIFVTVTETYNDGGGDFPGLPPYSRSIPVNLSVAGPAGGGIVSSVWSIFKKSDLLNAVQSFTCATNCNYIAASLTANDYQTKLQITNSAGQTDSAVKDFRVNPALSVASVAVTEADYCVSGPAATFNWTLSGSGVQSAYQVQAGDTGGSDFTVLYADSGKVNSNGNSYSSTLTFPTNTSCSPKPDCTYDPNGPPAFNTTMKARVRVWGSTDTPSNWTYSGSWKTPKHAYPSVNFSWSPLSPSAEQQVQFSADLTQFFDAGGVGQRAWNWLFKAPSSSPSSTLQNPTYTYGSPGLYNASLTVTDKDGYSCSRTKPISVDRPIPIWKEVGPK